MLTKIEYNNSIVAEIPNGSTATLPVKGKEMATDIMVTVAVETWDGTGALAVFVTDLVITIETTTYSILPLMTWYEWANSEYNTGGFTCSSEDDTILNSGGSKYITDSNGNIVYGSDLIVIGGAYTTQYPASLFSANGSAIVDANGAIITLKE